MNVEFVHALGMALQPQECKCPFKTKPPRNAKLIGKVLPNEQPFFVLAAELRKQGFGEIAERFAQYMGQNVIRRIRHNPVFVTLDMNPPKMVFASDWNVYEARRK